jgi:hypothetical protein
MSSRHGRSSSHERTNNNNSSQQSSPRTRPLNSRNDSSRSTLRSAEEQLRNIREGDTSWQLNHVPPVKGITIPDKTGSPNKVAVTQTNLGTPEQTVRVYLHHVRKTDTMPLILLAYEISAMVLKKANRMWATDSIQSRKKLYLPVDECNVKSEPCSRPQTPNESHHDKTERVEMHGVNGDWPPRLPQETPPPTEEVPEAESWVSIPAIGPIQIISLPAHKLSYFPTQQLNGMERSTSLPTLDSLVAEDKAPRDSMDSVASRSSIGSLVEDGVGRVVRFWHDNQGRKKWAKIGKDLIEL